MTFISYAQNFEDVMLWRALKHVHEGFYVDVGAWSPDLDSVTMAFYERGWRGINIEPNPEFHEQLQGTRSRNVNLCLALSDASGTGTLNIVSNTGLSTMDDEIAEEHSKAGYAVERESVELATLSQVWEKHVPEHQEVHFLKVDVEGFEERVLRGNDWTRHRPWIILVEATRPLSQDETYGAWEPLLIQNDYLMAYADGLNRFYVSREHNDLMRALRYPPNVFDAFKQYTFVDLENRLARTTESAQQAQSRAQELLEQKNKEYSRRESMAEELLAKRETNKEMESELVAAKEEAERLNSALAAAYASWSWRITWPLRALLGFLVWLPHALKYVVPTHRRQQGLELGAGVRLFNVPKRLAQSLLSKSMRYVLQRPGLGEKINDRLKNYSTLHAHLLQFARHHSLYEQTKVESSNENQAQGMRRIDNKENLSPHARQIYYQLLGAIEQKSREEK